MNPLQTRLLRAAAIGAALQRADFFARKRVLAWLGALAAISIPIACSTPSPPSRNMPVPVPVPASVPANPAASANAPASASPALNAPSPVPALPSIAPHLTSAAPPSTASAPPTPSPLSVPDLAAAAERNAESSPPPAPLKHHYVVAAIGDSLTDLRSHGGGYLEYVKTRCPGIEIDNFGKGATMVVQMRRSFQQQVAASAKHYTHIVVFGGVNDLYSDLTAHRTPAKVEADLSVMYGWAKEHGVKVVALTVAPWGGFKRYFNASRADATREVNAWIREQPARGKVDSVVDAYALLSCGDPEVLCDRFFAPFRDGIHFGPEGHQILGQALYRAAFSDCD